MTAEPDEMLEALDAEEEAAIRADAAVPGAIGLGRTMVLRLLATLDAARHAATDDTAREPDGGWEAWIGDEEEVARILNEKENT